jgi:acetyl esterase/lipase
MSTSHAPPGAPAPNERDPLISSPTSITPRLPLTRRLYAFFCLWGFKIFVNNALRGLRLNNYLRSKDQPTLQTYYDVRPNLEVRVFFPPGHTPNSSSTKDTKLPTYLNIHGGGFALCDPIVDDSFCTAMSKTHNFLVVSLSYSLAPIHPFPTPVHDIRALITAVLADSRLPIDHDRIALGGFSAGGNLALAAAQEPPIGSKIKAIIPVYPVVDFSSRYKGKHRTSADGRPDALARSGEWFSWGYINPGQDQTDTLLSPVYATREMLPQRMFFVGAEFDVLCKEAWCMAKLLAGKEVKGADDDEQPSREDRDWEEGGVRWQMVLDQRHGFTHAPERDAAKEKERVEITAKLWGEMAAWLRGALEMS